MIHLKTTSKHSEPRGSRPFIHSPRPQHEPSHGFRMGALAAAFEAKPCAALPTKSHLPHTQVKAQGSSRGTVQRVVDSCAHRTQHTWKLREGPTPSTTIGNAFQRERTGRLRIRWLCDRGSWASLGSNKRNKVKATEPYLLKSTSTSPPANTNKKICHRHYGLVALSTGVVRPPTPPEENAATHSRCKLTTKDEFRKKVHLHN